MNGLEAVEIKFSYVKNIVDFRIDAETYDKKFLETEKVLANKKVKSIDDLSVSVQNFGAYSLCNYIYFVDKGFPFLQTQDISENLIDFSNNLYITKDVHELLYKSHCKRRQVLLTMAGAYLGKAAVFNEDFECSSNQAIAKISLKKEIDEFYVSTL